MSADVPHDDRDDEPRPWERAGAVRRDCVSHRGALLDGLAQAAVALFVVPPIALILGAWVVVETGRDLRRMEAGRMDPAGEQHTRQARVTALAAMGMGAFLLAGLGALYLANLLGLLP